MGQPGEGAAEAIKYVNGGEGTLAVDEMDSLACGSTSSLVGISDVSERKQMLKWFARIAYLSSVGGVVIIGSLPGILNSQQTGDVNDPNQRSTFLLGVLGGVAYLSIALFSKVLPAFAEVVGHRPQLFVSLAGQLCSGLLVGAGGLAGGSETSGGIACYCAAMVVSGASAPFTDFVTQMTTEVCDGVGEGAALENALGYVSAYGFFLGFISGVVLLAVSITVLAWNGGRWTAITSVAVACVCFALARIPRPKFRRLRGPDVLSYERSVAGGDDRRHTHPRDFTAGAQARLRWHLPTRADLADAPSERR